MILDHEQKSDEMCTDKITILSDIALYLNADASDFATPLNQYKKQLQIICDCIDLSTHECLRGFSVILQEGLDLLIREKRELTKYESSFLQKIPHILSEYIFIPESKIPDAHLLNHLKNRYWIRPVSDAEEKIFIDLLTSSPAENKPDSTPFSNQNTSSEQHENFDDHLFDDHLDIDNVVSSFSQPPVTEEIINKTDTESLLHAQENITNTTSTDEYILDLNELNQDIEIDSPDDDFIISTEDETLTLEEAPDRQSASIITEQQSADDQEGLIALIRDELDEIIDDGTHCDIPDNIDSSELHSHLTNIAELIEHMSNTIDMTGLEGLGSSCRVIAINIHTLAIAGNTLSDQQKLLIEKWPLHILLYLQSIPEASETDNIIQYLSNPDWPYTLTSEDISKLRSLLTSPHLTKTEEDIPHESLDSINADAFENSLHEQALETNDVADELDIESLQYIQESTNDITDTDDSTILDLNDFDQSMELDSAPDDIPLSTENNNIVLEENSAEQNNLAVTDQQHELITLISDELEEIIEDETLCSIPDNTDSTELNDHLINIAELIEHMSNAIDMIGLEGLGNSCRIISRNIHTLAVDESRLFEQQISLIEKWPHHILLYLQNISINGESTDNSSDIIQYLSNTAWTDTLTNKEKSNLQSLLDSPQLKEEEKTIRQDIANANDISLELPDDVNIELLDALLQDLPAQTEEFSNALQNMQTQNNIEYLDVAQRIAHTLKGASNVVGVKGIANLTHHLEDILEIQSKANKLPSAELQAILSDTADCLETMSEALLGIDNPPDNGLEIFQSILDWANKLDTEGATDKSQDTTSKTEPSSLFAIKTDEQNFVPLKQNSTPSNTSIEAVLRVPVTLADELLRLTGENLISTSQIQEYIKTIKNRHNGLKTHNQSLQKLSFDLEHIIDIQGVLNKNQSAVSEIFDPLELDEFHELHAMSRQLVEIAADFIGLTQILEKDLSQLHGLVLSQDKLQKESQDLVLKTRMVPTKSIIPRLKRGVKQVCRLTNKQVELEVQHNNTQMDSEVLHRMIEPLMHILRNAVDHGIESTEQRITAGKNPTGLIKLTFTGEGDQIKIRIQDDGQGLSTDKIKDKAIKLGIINEQNDSAATNFKMLILHPGFSTRNEVNQVSGRGIGLDVVNSSIRELKGSLDIDSEQGQGCTFTLMLPLSSFSTQSLLIRVRENTYTFSNRGIEEILYPGNGRMLNLGHETVFKYNGKIYNTCFIDDLFSLPENKHNIDLHNCPVILVKEDTGDNVAILVQEIIDSQNVVVKSMGAFIPKLPGIVGATVLGDGGISPVIDIPELLQSINSMPVHIKQQKDLSNDSSEAEADEQAYVLVVDDSLSARKSLAQFVQDLGLEVHTARDGIEAVSLIKARKPDLILVDMEMPGMNGLELTSHIRADAKTHDMPVIMITSRSTEKHRQTAINRGVNHYMVKPFAEEELASHIQVALKIA